MIEQATCQICYRGTPPEGRKVCDSCMGFDRTEPPQNIEPPTESTLNLCHTCGAPVEPYKLGRNLITSGICHPCLMRRKYGTEWVKGGSPAKRKASDDKYRARKKAAMQEAQKIIEESGKLLRGESEPVEDKAKEASKILEKAQAENDANADKAKEASKLFDERYPWIKEARMAVNDPVKYLSLAFIGDDEAMFTRLEALAKKERRTMEQQVLWFLERTIDLAGTPEA